MRRAIRAAMVLNPDVEKELNRVAYGADPMTRRIIDYIRRDD
jgi:hypothetical protein